MRVLGALLTAVAVITTSNYVARANPSTITSIDVARVQPVGSYAGLPFRYIEGAIHGEVSAEEPIAGLRELAAGRATVPYEVIFHIVAPEAASDADAVVVEAPNRGRTIFPSAIGVGAAVTGPNADPVASVINDGFLLSHRISVAAVQWQTGFRRRRAPERARDRRDCRPGFWPLAWRRVPKRSLSPAHLPPSYPGRREPSRLVRKQFHRRRLQCRS